MSFPPVTQDQIAFGAVSYCSTGLMVMPTGSPHVRSIEFRLPRLTVCPSVSHQIVGSREASPLVVYALKINDDVGGMTQIAIEAQTLDGKAAVGTHNCNIVAIAQPSDPNSLVGRVEAIEHRLNAPRQQSGHAQMTNQSDGSWSLKVNIGWRPSSVNTSPRVGVEMHDDGFRLFDRIYAATDWIAYG